VDDVERPEGFDNGDDDDDDVHRAHGREDHLEEGLDRVGSVDLGRLAQGRIHALEPGQVQDHDVAGVPPGGGEEGRPDVAAGIPEPVDGLGRAGGAKQKVQEAAVPVVEQLPDDPDQGQGEHYRGEENALVDPRAADVL